MSLLSPLKKLLLEAENGEMEICINSKQNPKSRYYHVYDQEKEYKFQLYFDDGT